MAWQFIRRGSEMFCGFVTATFRVFVLVLAITTFSNSTSTDSKVCNSPSAPPSAQEIYGCDTNKLQGNIIAYERYIACFQTIALLMIYLARTVVENAYESDERAAKDDDTQFKKAKSALDVANKELQTAREARIKLAESVSKSPEDEARVAADLDAAAEAEKKSKHDVERARMEVYRRWPKEGMQRFPLKCRIAVRVSFLSSVLCSQASSLLAGLAFYNSLEIQLHCKPGGFLATFAFSGVAICSLAFHGFFGWIAGSQI